MMFTLHLYQIVIIILAIISILYVYSRVRKDKIARPVLFLWIGLWILIFIFAFIPQVTSVLASLFGITRGLDFILICGIFFAMITYSFF